MPLQLFFTEQPVNMHWGGMLFVYAAASYSEPKWQTTVGTSQDGKEWKFVNSNDIGSLISQGCGLYSAIQAQIDGKDYIIAGGFGTSTLEGDDGAIVVVTSPVLAASVDKGKTWNDLNLPILKPKMIEIPGGPGGAPIKVAINFGECTGVGYNVKTKRIYAAAVYQTSNEPEGASELRLYLYEGTIQGGFSQGPMKTFTIASLQAGPPPTPPWPDGALVNDRTISVRGTPERDYLYYSGTSATYATSNCQNQRVEPKIDNPDHVFVDLDDNPDPYISATVGTSGLILYVKQNGQIVKGGAASGASPPLGADFESEYVMGSGFFQGAHNAATISYAGQVEQG